MMVGCMFAWGIGLAQAGAFVSTVTSHSTKLAGPVVFTTSARAVNIPLVSGASTRTVPLAPMVRSIPTRVPLMSRRAVFPMQLGLEISNE